MHVEDSNRSGLVWLASIIKREYCLCCVVTRAPDSSRPFSHLSSCTLVTLMPPWVIQAASTLIPGALCVPKAGGTPVTTCLTRQVVEVSIWPGGSHTSTTDQPRQPFPRLVASPRFEATMIMLCQGRAQLSVDENRRLMQRRGI